MAGSRILFKPVSSLLKILPSLPSHSKAVPPFLSLPISSLLLSSLSSSLSPFHLLSSLLPASPLPFSSSLHLPCPPLSPLSLPSYFSSHHLPSQSLSRPQWLPHCSSHPQAHACLMAFAMAAPSSWKALTSGTTKVCFLMSFEDLSKSHLLILNPLLSLSLFIVSQAFSTSKDLAYGVGKSV